MWLLCARSFALVGLVAVVGVALSAADDVEAKRGNIGAGGAFTCDFGLPSDMDFSGVPAILETDRIHQSAREGFMRKLVPLRIEFSTGELFSGGRYLFSSREDADAYKTWLETEFALDGVPFFSRPYFLQSECHAWSVIGAHDFAPVDSHVVIRTERWSVPDTNQRTLLMERWTALAAEAQRRGLAGVWLLYHKQERLVSVVSFGLRVAAPDPTSPDFASLGAIEGMPPLGDLFADQPWVRTFDRSHWTLTTWFPYVEGDQGEPSLWPNSPPFPRP